MSDQDIELEARLTEQEYFEPPEEFVEQANVSDPAVYDRFDEFPEGFEEYAEMLDWDEEWDTVLDDSNPPFYEWFVGGKLNASANCIDRHLDDRGDETAILWEGEEGETRHISYRELYEDVNEMAAALRAAGVEEDEVVTIHMPMVPALPVTMLACARIGAPHSVVFGGFSATALADRVNSADSDHVVTIDGYYRRGDFLNHIAESRRGDGERRPRPRGARLDAPRRTRSRRQRRLHPRRRPPRRTRGRGGRAGIPRRRGPTVPDVHLGHDWPAEGLSAPNRWLSRLRGGDLQLRRGHQARGHLLVFGRHRLDHRPHLHRLRPARARDDDGDVRGRAGLPEQEPHLGDRRGVRRRHLPHLADRGAPVHEVGPGTHRGPRLRLPAHDHRGRTHPARSAGSGTTNTSATRTQ